MNDEQFNMHEGWNSLAADLLYAYMEQVPVRELDFYERRIRENGGLALDQACGTGRHLFPLCERGLTVHGADITEEVLRYARRVAASKELDVQLFHQSMEACDLPHRYGTIYVANGTFHILSDRQVAQATLRRFWQHLSPGGQLLIELYIPPEVTKGIHVQDAEHPTVWAPMPRRDAEGEIVTTLWSESVDLFEQTLVSKRRNELMVDGTCVRSEVHSHRLRWYFKHEFTMMLEHAGFEDIQIYADFTDEPASQDTTAFIYGARRADWHHEGQIDDGHGSR